MTTDMISGVFVSEMKNRFLCLVRINGEVTECYIPSSCKLSNFLLLDGKEVLLKRTKGKKTRTEYLVYAVKYRRSYLILNLAQANNAIEKEIHRRLFCDLGPRKHVSREVTIDDYKSDLFINDSKTIIEIKSILTTDKKALFPTVYSERALNQLSKIEKLLKNGYSVCYMLVSLNPYVEVIELNNQDLEFYNLFSDCIKRGTKCFGVTLKISDGNPRVFRRVKVNGLTDYFG